MRRPLGTDTESGHVAKETLMSALIFFLLCLGILILFLLPDGRAAAIDEGEEARSETKELQILKRKI